MGVTCAKIEYDNYKVKAFLDTNIILEGRPLAELPWQEIDANGPILALLTPTAIKEIDSKKQDGRIGKRAREFNRLIASVAAGGPPIVIRESAPRVHLALSRAVRIPWDQHDDLDPDDGDSCIVAEVLHARDMSAAGKLLVSHDIKPIAFASNYDVPTLHVSDNWLRQTEPHPKDRVIQKLNQELAQYKASEPAFEISLELINAEPISLVRIEDLSDAERATIESRIQYLNPPVEQARGAYGILASIGTYDHSYDERFKAYRRRVPVFMAHYAQRLERLFNQARFRLEVLNTSQVQAENLLVEVHVTNGWLHDRFVFVSPQGPIKPTPLEMPIIPMANLRSMIPPRVGRHEFEYKKAPNYGRAFSATCEDFRFRQKYVFEGVVSFDARAAEVTEISVAVTASNFRGTADATKSIERKIETVHVSKLIDMNALKIPVPLPMQALLDNQDYKSIDWKALDNEGDEDD
jgi:hypothetical protein